MERTQVYILICVLLTLALTYVLDRYRRYRSNARTEIDRRSNVRRGSYGFIYFYTIVIIPLPFLDWITLPFIKIGRAKTAPQRLKAQRTPLPFGMKVRAVVMVRNDVKSETYTHDRYKRIRLHKDRKNEWFWFTPELWLFMVSVRDGKLTRRVREQVEWKWYDNN